MRCTMTHVVSEWRWKVLTLGVLFGASLLGYEAVAQDQPRDRNCYAPTVRISDVDCSDDFLCLTFRIHSPGSPRACNLLSADFSAIVVPGFPIERVDTNGTLELTYCFYNSSWENPFCYSFDFSGLCCDVKDCVDLSDETKKCCKYRSRIDERPLQCSIGTEDHARYTKQFVFTPVGDGGRCTNFDILIDPPISADINIVGTNVEVSFNEEDLPIGTEQVCITVDFDNPLCCDFTLCDSLNCCERDLSWALVRNTIECKPKPEDLVVRLVPCFDIVVDLANNIHFCDTPDLLTNLPLLPGTFEQGFESDGYYHFRGCLNPDSLDTDTFCYKLDFPYAPPDLVCCDIQGCMKVPDCRMHDMQLERIYCEQYSDQGVTKTLYCADFRVPDVVANQVQCGVWIQGQYVAADVCETSLQDGGTYIKVCIDSSKVPHDIDSLTWVIQYNVDNVTLKSAFKTQRPPCCDSYQYTFSLWCDTTSKEFDYCFRLQIFGGARCGNWTVNSNATDLTYSTATTPLDDYIIEGCFTGVIHIPELPPVFCLELTPDNPSCCPIKACEAIQPCCSPVDWKGYAACDSFTVPGSTIAGKGYCFEIVLLNARENCYAFTFDITNGELIDGTKQVVVRGDDIVITGCVDTSTVDTSDLCFYIHFLTGNNCCDIQGCIPIRKPCCEEHAITEKLECKIKPDGTKEWCVVILVEEGEFCGGFDFYHNAVGSPHYWIGHPGVDLSIEMCFDEVVSLTQPEQFCYTIDFDDDLCCDYRNRCIDLRCCDQVDWKGYAECDTIQTPTTPNLPAYCFELVLIDAADCGIANFDITNGDLIGHTTSVSGNNIILRGCVVANSVSDSVLCFEVDFDSDSCCDFSGCLPIRKTCCDPYDWHGKTWCDTLAYPDRLIPAYCYEIVIPGADECADTTVRITFAWDKSGTSWIKEVQKLSGDLIIQGCIPQDSVPYNHDSLCFFIDFPNPQCCDIRGCLPRPSCCQKVEYTYRTYCDMVDGDSLYCMKLWLYDTTNCADYVVRLIAGSDTFEMPSSGDQLVDSYLEIVRCIPVAEVDTSVDSICVEVDFSSDKCCDIEFCIPRSEWCEEKSCRYVFFRNEVTCDTLFDIDYNWYPVYCYRFSGLVMRKCGPFRWRIVDSDGRDLPLIDPMVDNTPPKIDFTGCIYIDSLRDERICLEVDFIDSICCDTTVCIGVPNCGTVRIQTLEEGAGQWVVYPNPASDVLIIESNTDNRPYEVSLWNVYGHYVLKQNIQAAQTTIDLQRLPRGVYLLRIRDLERPDIQTHLRILLH